MIVGIRTQLVLLRETERAARDDDVRRPQPGRTLPERERSLRHRHRARGRDDAVRDAELKRSRLVEAHLALDRTARRRNRIRRLREGPVDIRIVRVPFVLVHVERGGTVEALDRRIRVRVERADTLRMAMEVPCTIDACLGRRQIETPVAEEIDVHRNGIIGVVVLDLVVAPGRHVAISVSRAVEVQLLRAALPRAPIHGLVRDDDRPLRAPVDVELLVGRAVAACEDHSGGGRELKSIDSVVRLRHIRAVVDVRRVGRITNRLAQGGPLREVHHDLLRNPRVGHRQTVILPLQDAHLGGSRRIGRTKRFVPVCIRTVHVDHNRPRVGGIRGPEVDLAIARRRHLGVAGGRIGQQTVHVERRVGRHGPRLVARGEGERRVERDGARLCVVRKRDATRAEAEGRIRPQGLEREGGDVRGEGESVEGIARADVHRAAVVGGRGEGRRERTARHVRRHRDALPVPDLRRVIVDRTRPKRRARHHGDRTRAREARKGLRTGGGARIGRVLDAIHAANLQNVRVEDEMLDT